MDEEKRFGKTYDRKIVEKLFLFLIPYKYYIFFILGSTVLIAGLRVCIPILIQKIIDNSISVTYTKIKDYSELPPEYISNLNSISNKYLVGSDVYVYKSKIGELYSLDWINQQKEKGVIDDLDYYVAQIDKESQEIIDKYPELFQLSSGFFAIDYENSMAKLTLEEKLALKNKDLKELESGSFWLLVILLVILLFVILKGITILFAETRLVKDIRMALFEKTSRQSLRFLQDNPVGKLVTRMTNDVQSISNFMNVAMSEFLRNITILIGASLAIFFLDFRFSLILLATIPVLVIATYFYRKLARKAFIILRILISNLNVFLAENFSGVEVIKHFAHEKNSFKKFEEKSEELFLAQRRQLYIFAFFRPLMEFIGVTSIAIIIYFSSKEVLEYKISLGVLIAFLNLLNSFYEPIKEIAELFTQLQQAMAGGERVFEMLDTEMAIEDNGNMVLKKENTKGKIEFKNVHFSYTKDKQVLNGMNFTINPGQTIALVGYTGSGKTTITNLVTRMWDIQNGSILLDGINIKDLKLSNLRSSIQSLQQDVFLFNDTIRNNIIMGLDLDEKRIYQIVELAQLTDFVNGLDDGLDHIIEEGSKNVSAGQRQLIAFARIIAQDPKVIIMDEATANIDTETESKIQLAMNELIKNRTAIIVAHRLSTIQHADKILVLKDGRLIESGSHEELIEIDNGIYQNLYKLQYQEID